MVFHTVIIIYDKNNLFIPPIKTYEICLHGNASQRKSIKVNCQLPRQNAIKNALDIHSYTIHTHMHAYARLQFAHNPNTPLIKNLFTLHSLECFFCCIYLILTNNLFYRFYIHLKQYNIPTSNRRQIHADEDGIKANRTERQYKLD